MFKVKRFKGDTIVFFIGAALLIALGVVLLPMVTSLGSEILNYVIAAGILVYVFSYLLTKIKRSGGKVKLLTIIETVLMLLVALGLILAQFKIINVSDIGAILGLALALRGSVEMFRAYYHQAGSSAKYPLTSFVINLAILIFGVYMFAKPFITNQDLIIVMAVVCFVAAALLLVLAFQYVAKDKGKKSQKKSK